MDMSVRLNLSYPAAKPASDIVAVEAVNKVAEPYQVVPVAGASKSDSSDLDDAKVKAAAEDIQKFLHLTKRNLEFSIDETSGKVVVKVIASDSGEVIRQIPNEEVLKLAEGLNDTGSMVFNAKV